MHKWALDEKGKQTDLVLNWSNFSIFWPTTHMRKTKLNQINAKNWSKDTWDPTLLLDYGNIQILSTSSHHTEKVYNGETKQEQVYV